MALHPAIEKINREPMHEALITSGFQRQSSLFVKILLKKEYWGAVDPMDLLTDDRLPAAYSAWPVHPYPQTDHEGTLLAAYAVKDALRILQSVSLTSRNTHSSVELRYDYESNPAVPAGYLPAALRQDPAGSPAGGDLGYKIAYDKEEIEVPYTIDALNAKVQISSGERPVPLPTRKLMIRVCRITRLEPNHAIDWHDTFAYTLNNATWNGRPQETVCCFPVTYSDWQEIGGALWWPVNYEFRWLAKDNAPGDLRPTHSAVDFWRDIILSMSLNQKVAAGGVKPIILNGNRFTEPQGLDADGHFINPPGSAAPHQTTFRKIATKSFAPLNITLPAQYTPP
jgi:hypothetical protein